MASETTPRTDAPSDPASGNVTPADQGREGPWGRTYRRLTLGLIMTIVAGAFEAMAVATILPQTVDELGGLEYYGWLFSAFTLANLVGIVVAGGEIDHGGPLRPFTIGIVLFVVGLAIGAAAPSMAVLIAGRAVQGFASGMLGSIAYAAVGIAYPEALRPRMLALWATAWVVPGLLGPAASGVIADQIDWRWVFAGLIPFAVIAAALAFDPLRRIPARAPRPRDPERIRDAVVLAFGVSLFLTGIGLSNPVLGVLLAVGGLAVAALPFRRLAPPGVFRAAGGPAAGVMAILLLNVGFFGVEAFVPLALTDLRHRNPIFAGLPLTVAALTWTAGAWMLDHWASRARRSRMVRLGLITIALGCFVFLTVLRDATPIAVSLLAWGIAGLGMGLAYSTIQLVVLESAPKGQEGVATASLQLGNSLGIALSAGVGGAIVAALSDGDDATARGILVQSLVMISALFVAWLVAARLPERSAEPPTA